MICHGTPCRPCVRADGSAHEDPDLRHQLRPELTGIGKYSAEMAEWLAARGHSVSVVTAPPYYPQWRVHDGYRAGRYAREERAGVSVRRARCGCRRGPAASSACCTSSFALSSLPSLRAAAGRPTSSWWSSRRCSARPRHGWARLCGARAWLHVQDYEVDAAFELGLLSLAARAVARAERWLMRRFDRVSTISERMLALARDRAWSPPAPCCCRTGSTRRRSRRTWTAARTARNSASPPTRSWRCIPATWAANRACGSWPT